MRKTRQTPRDSQVFRRLDSLAVWERISGPQDPSYHWYLGNKRSPTVAVLLLPPSPTNGTDTLFALHCSFAIIMRLKLSPPARLELRIDLPNHPSYRYTMNIEIINDFAQQVFTADESFSFTATSFY